jgi:hypothetical protein
MLFLNFVINNSIEFENAVKENAFVVSALKTYIYIYTYIYVS